MRWIVPILIAMLLFGAAQAQDPDEALDDEQAEARAIRISQQLRCVVCQNQSIQDSNADLARDLRLLVRERVAAGDTNEEVLDYVVARYGEFVLLRPRFEGEGIVLWLMPALFLLIGAGLTAWYLRAPRRAQPVPAALSAEERAALEQLLRDEADAKEPHPPANEKSDDV